MAGADDREPDMTGAPEPAVAERFRALARPSGGFAMVAIDQRESLRAMLADTDPRAVVDEDLVGFKHDVISALSGSASAILVDRALGLAAVAQAGGLAPTAGLIVAADRLEQAPGGPVRAVTLDVEAASAAREAGAVALKLLVPWRTDRPVDERAELVKAFLALCREHGFLGLVEGLVQDDGRHEDAWYWTNGILAAGEEIADLGPDVYKAQVPTLGLGSPAEVEALSRRLTALIGRPWVVLSQGVAPERFEASVLAACRGGASGFLAGRAIWTSALRAPDRHRHLAEVGRERLARLAAVVDGAARPWHAALTADPADSPDLT